MRQTAIIKQLEQLRLKLNDMQTKLGASDIKSTTVASKSTVAQKQQAAPVAKPIDVSQTNVHKNVHSQRNMHDGNSIAFFCFLVQVKHLQDIVIHVNPANVPYSLLGLKKLWTNRLNLTIDCYTHSSIAELPQQNQAFAAQLKAIESQSKSDVPSLNVSLIWKQTPTTDLVCAPGTFIPITGEANILRYLMRIGPSEYGYGNSIQANLETDAIFDLTYELVMTTARDHRLSILKRLSQRLNTQKAFCGDLSNVSNLVVFSTLKQLHISGKELPANLKLWLELSKSLI